MEPSASGQQAPPGPADGKGDRIGGRLLPSKSVAADDRDSTIFALLQRLSGQGQDGLVADAEHTGCGEESFDAWLHQAWLDRVIEQLGGDTNVIQVTGFAHGLVTTEDLDRLLKGEAPGDRGDGSAVGYAAGDNLMNAIAWSPRVRGMLFAGESPAEAFAVEEKGRPLLLSCSTWFFPTVVSGEVKEADELAQRERAEAKQVGRYLVFSILAQDMMHYVEVLVDVWMGIVIAWDGLEPGTGAAAGMSHGVRNKLAQARPKSPPISAQCNSNALRSVLTAIPRYP